MRGGAEGGGREGEAGRKETGGKSQSSRVVASPFPTSLRGPPALLPSIPPAPRHSLLPSFPPSIFSRRSLHSLKPLPRSFHPSPPPPTPTLPSLHTPAMAAMPFSRKARVWVSSVVIGVEEAFLSSLAVAHGIGDVFAVEEGWDAFAVVKVGGSDAGIERRKDKA